MSDKDKKVDILNNQTYLEVCSFIKNYNGLAIDCELDILKKFPTINEQTLSSILFTEQNYLIKLNFHKYMSQSTRLLKQFDKIAIQNPYNTQIIINMSNRMDISPTVLSRILVTEKYKNIPKAKITEILKNCYLIKDNCLANNVQASVCSDNQEGPIGDIVRRCVGEEYEIKLKEMAKETGMLYLDEADLRRTGFDKTPDLKLALPCLYNGNIINWIESKALFGDVRTHKRYLTKQLQSYSNRFGAGAVIYWFGYHEDILNLKENGDNLTILNGFPETEYLQFLKL